MRISVKNLVPGSGKLDGIYKGVVEDNKDPDKRGRVRIRIIGIHTNIKETSDYAGVPTEALPWAEPVLSTFEGSISGLGAWFVPVQGSHVYVFFENGNLMQPRYFGTAAGVPKKKANPKLGFNDPDGVYPLESMVGKPDWHPLARGEDSSVYDDRKTNKIKNASTAAGTSWDEPDPFYFESKPVYPDNIVIALRGGFLFEFDGTENAQRFSFMHPNAYIEINKDGKMIIRNKSDRYDICDGIYYKYCKDDKHQTIGGSHTTAVAEDKKTAIVKEETRVVGSGQAIAVKGTQTTSVIQKQEINVKGRRTIGVWGSETKETKGSANRTVMGMSNHNFFGIKRDNINAYCEKNSAGPHKVGSSSSVLLGRGPITKATATLNSAISGFNAAIIESLQPIMDTFNAVQTVVDQNISEIVNFANNELKPLTDMITNAQAVVNLVKQEFNSLQNFAQTAVDAPFRIASSVGGYVNKIINTPGYMIQNILNQVIGIPNQLNCLRGLSSLYMSAKDLGNMGGMQVQVRDFNTLFDGIFNFNGYTGLGELDLYGRSGLSSYLGGTYTRMGIQYNDYYMIGETPSATTTWGQYRGTGTLETELYQAQLMMSDTLCAAHFDIEGNFQIRSAIGALWNVDTMYDKLLDEGTVEQLNTGGCVTEDYTDPISASIPQTNCFIDPDVLSDFGYIIETPLLSAGGLTGEQQDHTIPTLQMYTKISQEVRSLLWDYIDDESSLYDLYYVSGDLTEEIYLSFQVIGETEEEFEERMRSNTAISILNITITDDIDANFETTKENLYEFARFNQEAISASYVEFFEYLIQAEAELVTLISQIDPDDISWDGKDDDFSEAASAVGII